MSSLPQPPPLPRHRWPKLTSPPSEPLRNCPLPPLQRAPHPRCAEAREHAGRTFDTSRSKIFSYRWTRRTSTPSDRRARCPSSTRPRPTLSPCSTRRFPPTSLQPTSYKNCLAQGGRLRRRRRTTTARGDRLFRWFKQQFRS